MQCIFHTYKHGADGIFTLVVISRNSSFYELTISAFVFVLATCDTILSNLRYARSINLGVWV